MRRHQFYYFLSRLLKSTLSLDGAGGGGGRRGSVADDSNQTAMATLELARGSNVGGGAGAAGRADTLWKKPPGVTGSPSAMDAISEAAAAQGRLDPRVGRRCTVEGYSCKGTVRFAGVHHTSGSDRFLVELDEPLGKNDGTVKGFQYCAVRPKHGVLIHPSKVTLKAAGGGGGGASMPGLKGAGKSMQSLTTTTVTNPSFDGLGGGAGGGGGGPPPIRLETYNEHMANQNQGGNGDGGGGCCTVL